MNSNNQDPLHDELAYHFEQLKQARLDAGDSDQEAARKAHLKLGSNARIQDEVRDTSLPHRLEMAARHFRFAFRSYRRNGGAYILATAILVLGIGLSVAMFSLVEAVVLNPLPFPNQDRVHVLWKTDTQVNQQLVGELAYPELDDLHANTNEIEYAALIPAALYGNGRVLQVGTQEPVQIETCPSSTDFFKVLGVSPVFGRGFDSRDAVAGSAPVVMLSDAVWREHFGARADVVGQMTRLNGVGHMVIGVMPKDFDFPRGARLWVPLQVNVHRDATWLQAVIRVKPGITRERLQQAADRTLALQKIEYPKVYSPTERATVIPIVEYWTGSSKIQLILSLFASVLLLLSACVSASNLFLSRALGRRREVATRVSLGASPSRILVAFATEGMLAAAIATAAGAALAWAAIEVLIRLAPAEIPRVEMAHIDLQALAFAAATALIAAIACSAGPALLMRARNLETLMRDGGMRTAGSRTGRRLQSLFVFSQAALTVSILAVGLLLMFSYQAMIRTPVGFANRDTLTMNLALRGQSVTPEKRRQFYFELLNRLRAEPEVISAAAVLLRPFEGPIGWDTESMFEFEAGLHQPNQIAKANFEAVTPHYFETVGTPLIDGRDFDERDSETAENVVIVSQSLARRARAATGKDPIGQRLHTFYGWRKIVGIAGDARYRRVVQSGDDVYVPYRQVKVATNYLVIRGRTTTPELLALVRRQLKEVDPAQAIAGEATLGDLIEHNTARDRFNVSLMILFAVGAVTLAGAGIHSVVRESVAVRAKELAVRVALGATRSRLAVQTTRNALLFVVTGELLGLLAAFLIARAIIGLLYGVAPADARIYSSAAALVLAVAALAALIPAWIAAGRDPQRYLQQG